MITEKLSVVNGGNGAAAGTAQAPALGSSCFFPSSLPPSATALSEKSALPCGDPCGDPVEKDFGVDVGGSCEKDVDVELPSVWEVCKLGNENLVAMYEKAVALGYDVITPNRLEDLRHCGDYLKFAHIKGVGRKLAGASFCRLRLCPMCQWRRSLKLYAQMSRILKAIADERPNCRFLFITCTIRNVGVDDLGVTLDKLNAAFKRLMNYWRPKRVVRGWVKCIEVTVNQKTGMTHPHIHALLLVDADYFGLDYIRQADWALMWRDAMQVDYTPSLDIQAVKEKGASAIGEVTGCFKYTLKKGESVARLAEMSDDVGINLLVGLTRQLHNRRFVAFGGMLADIRKKLKMSDAESLTDKDAVNTAEKAGLVTGYTRYGWRAKTGVYVEI